MLHREHWVAICGELREASTLTAGNGHAIRRLVEARVLYERAALDVAQRGALVPAPKTGTPIYNLNMTIMRQSEESCRMLESELGIAPVRRGRAAKVRPMSRVPLARDQYLRPADGYLRRVK
jgi:hypothetical protein